MANQQPPCSHSEEEEERLPTPANQRWDRVGRHSGRQGGRQAGVLCCGGIISQIDVASPGRNTQPLLETTLTNDQLHNEGSIKELAVRRDRTQEGFGGFEAELCV